MYSHDEIDPENKNCYLVRNMEDLDITKVSGIENLSGQYCWIDTPEDSGLEKDKFYVCEKKSKGFTIKEVVMEVYFKDGYYIAEFLSDLSLDSSVSWDNGSRDPLCTRHGTLKDAITSFLDGCLSDGIGENEIGVVKYNGHSYDVWFGDRIEIPCTN